jgi:L-alanine-DL-glutamate epimerase-like enolase superfamily enzyme
MLLEPYLVGARARVGEDLWRERSEEGRRMTLESAIDLALVDAGPRAPA